MKQANLGPFYFMLTDKKYNWGSGVKRSALNLDLALKKSMMFSCFKNCIHFLGYSSFINEIRGSNTDPDAESLFLPEGKS